MSAELPGSEPRVPPMQPVYVARAVPTRWPIVVGIIATVWGAISLLFGLWGLIAMVLMKNVTWGMDPEQAAVYREVTQAKLPLSATIGALGLLAAVLILVAGVGLLRRRAWSVRLARWWAVIQIVLAPIGIVIGWQMQAAVMSSMPQQGPAVPQDVMQVMRILGFIVGLIWGWALPIFVLIWLARPAIKAETRGWSGAGVPGERG